MRLHDLDATFIASTNNGFHRVDTIDKANGLFFQCPKCAEGKEIGDNECDCAQTPHAEWCDFGRRHHKGAHFILCWFRNPRVLPPVGPDMDPKPGRWWITPSSSSIDNITFDHGEPSMPKSILLLGGCCWHGFIQDGDAT